MKPWAGRAIIIIGLLTIVAGRPALAQAPVVYGDDGAVGSVSVVTDPGSIGRCLCAADVVSARREALLQAQQRYQSAKDHAEATRQEVERLRTQIDPHASETLDAYRRLLVESERAESDLFDRARPDDAKAVSRYNEAVADYNNGCAGRRFDAKIQAQIAQTLICPFP